MGLICDYFIADGDAAARATASWPLGPGRAPATKGGRFRKKAPEATAPFPSFEFPGIEPVVMLATLEEELTGTSADDVLHLNASAQVGSNGSVMVFRVRPQLVDALAAASEARLTEVASPWSQTEEFFGTGDPGVLASGLAGLAGLARQATESGQDVYCWMSP